MPESELRDEFAHVEFHRSQHGYGWTATLLVRGKHRVRWNSRKATTPMLWRFIRGGDEDCNRAITLTMWPIGMLDVWWEPKWRPAGSGLCDPCRAEIEAMSNPPDPEPEVVTKASGEPVDLLAALQRSLDAAKSARQGQSPADLVATIGCGCDCHRSGFGMTVSHVAPCCYPVQSPASPAGGESDG